MTAATTPPATLEPRPDVDWDRHGRDKRPKILPPPGETWRNPGTNRKVAHRYYTRVTTYADAITEAYNLTAWKLRRAVLGLGQRADYVRLAASYTADDRDRDALDELVGKALEAAGPNAADLGTALHSLTERLDRGEDLGTPPDEVLPDLAAYTAVTEGVLTMLLREPRTVCDELECAGTPDTIAIVAEAPPTGWGPSCDCPPDTPRVCDTKTGSIRYPGKMSTQLAIYAHSDRYDPATGARTPLGVCPHWGVIVHLPVETGEAALHWLDLEHGWRGAELCGPVREWRAVKTDDILRPFTTVMPVKVVDGEVTRIDPRAASTNLKPPVEPTEVRETLTEVDLGAALIERRADEALDPDPGYLENGDDLEAVLAEVPGNVEPVRCTAHETSDPGSPQCDRAAGHDITVEPHRFTVAVAPVERCVHELRVGECAMPSCRPDLAHLGDDGIEREQLTALAHGYLLDDVNARPEVERAELANEHRAEAAAAAYEASDGQYGASMVDPIREAITRCVTVRELESLGTREWRTWTEEHKTLAAEVHERLAYAEQVERPRAAAEAAITAAGNAEELTAVMLEVRDAEWMTAELFALADTRYWQLMGRKPVTA